MPSVSQEPISRTKKKKAALALQRIGERLVNLSRAQLEDLELPDELLEAVLMAKEMKKHEARRRQMQYIGSLMRQCDGDAIEKTLTDLTRQDDVEVRRFKQIERWRKDLLAGDNERLQWVLEHYPHSDEKRLRALILDARGFDGQVGGKKAARKLFRYLRMIREKETAGKTEQ